MKKELTVEAGTSKFPCSGNSPTPVVSLLTWKIIDRNKLSRSIFSQKHILHLMFSEYSSFCIFNIIISRSIFVFFRYYFQLIFHILHFSYFCFNLLIFISYLFLVFKLFLIILILWLKLSSQRMIWEHPFPRYSSKYHIS